MKNIAVIRAGALGDIILTLPAIKALRLRYPDASLRVAGYPSLWEVAGSLVDEVVSIDAAMFAGLFTGSPSDRFCDWLHKVDLVVAWTVRDACPALEACGVPHAVHASPYPPPGVHASDWLVGSMREELGPILGSAASTARQTGRVPTISLTPEEMGHGREVLAAMGLERSVAIHPGAGAPWKRWPAERFGALARELVRLGHQVVLIEGPADEEVVTEIQQQLAAEIPVLRRQPLRVLAAMLAHCALFVGNDSGVTHLAAAAGAPVLALFGPTDPVSWAPRGSGPEAIQVLRHCDRQTDRQEQVRVCDDPDCLKGIEVTEALQAAEALLANVQNPVENPRFSVDNFVDPLSTGGADRLHHHFDSPSSGDAPRV